MEVISSRPIYEEAGEVDAKGDWQEGQRQKQGPTRESRIATHAGSSEGAGINRLLLAR